MTAQLSLLDTSRTFVPPPATHQDDPVTSHRAETAITKSGKRRTQAEMVLDALKIYPRCTSAELAERMRVSRFMTARRLPDLRANNLARQCASRVCTATGAECVTWEAV